MGNKQANEKVPITAAEMQRFHRNAHAALKRRQGSYAFDEFGNGLRSVFLGVIPFLGILWWGWSPLQLVFFIVVGTWIAILCDLVKLILLHKQIHAWAKPTYDDWQVWTIVAALRAGRETALKSHLYGKYEPWKGVLVDFILGSVATLMIGVTLAKVENALEWQALRERDVIVSLVVLIVYQIGFTIWEIASHWLPRNQDQKVKVSVGMRGLGLFLLMFLLVWIADNQEKSPTAVTTTLLVVNGAIALWGMFTIIGPLLIKKEATWLKDYLAKRANEAGSKR
jgi:hypothetical protein